MATAERPPVAERVDERTGDDRRQEGLGANRRQAGLVPDCAEALGMPACSSDAAPPQGCGAGTPVPAGSSPPS